MQEIQLRTSQAEFQSLQTLLTVQDVTFFQQVKRCKGRDVFGKQNHQYAGLASKVMKVISTSCARETAEVRPFANRKTRRWTSHGEEISFEGIYVANRAKIAPFQDNSMIISRNCL